MLEGVVASIQPYGAFVTLPDSMSGLLHISQISHDRVSSVEQVLQMGQKLKVRRAPRPRAPRPPLLSWRAMRQLWCC